MKLVARRMDFLAKLRRIFSPIPGTASVFHSIILHPAHAPTAKKEKEKVDKEFIDILSFWSRAGPLVRQRVGRVLSRQSSICCTTPSTT
jgi:hypothetical protein